MNIFIKFLKITAILSLMSLIFLYTKGEFLRKSINIEYCVKQEKKDEGGGCEAKKNILIPSEFNPTKVSENWYAFEVTYPSMEAWSLRPSQSKIKAEKLTVALRGLSGGSAKFHFDSLTLGSPKFKINRHVYNLVEYQRILNKENNPRPEEERRQSILLPDETEPKLIINCILSPGSVSISDQLIEGDTSCTTTIYTPWQLMIQVTHGQSLIQHWGDLYIKLQALIEKMLVSY